MEITREPKTSVHTAAKRQLLKPPARYEGKKMAPGPKGHFLLGSLPERRKDPLKLFLSASRDYGDLVRLNFAGLTVHFANSPEYLKHVLQDNSKNYVKGFGYDKLMPLLGLGLLTSDGEYWRTQRKLAQPAFHREKIVSFATTMNQCIEDMMKSLSTSDGKVVDIHQEMYRLTIRIISLTMLSQDVLSKADSVSKSMDFLIEAANDRILSVFDFKYKLPLPGNRKFIQAIQIIDEMVYGFIKERRAATTQPPDLLSMLMSARDEDTGTGMSDVQLHDEIMTIFLAGHETTANALSFTWYLLSKHPEIQRKVRAEVSSVLGDRVPTFQDFPQLKYTRQVFEESMRLYPPAWVFSRQALADDEIGGYFIPKGSVVVMSPYAIHRNERYWENPEGFDPDRFSEEKSALRPKHAYLPFSAGPRQCIGSNFALMEAVFTVAQTVRGFDLSLVPGYKLELEPLVTLRPKNGIEMRVRKLF